MTSILTIDFETYYDSEYSLRNLSTPEYIQHPAFNVIGVAVAVGDQPAQSFTGNYHETLAWLKQFDWENSRMVAHNAQFDAAILSWHYGIEPAEYFCTMMGARPYIQPFKGSVSLEQCANFMTYSLGMDVGEKGKEVAKASGKQRFQFEPNEMDAYMEYCRQDVDLTVHLYKYITDTCDMPHDEQQQVHLTIRKFVDPQLLGATQFFKDQYDQHVADTHFLISSTGVPKSHLSSNAKFAKLLEDRGVTPPKKISPRTGQETYAFAKDDTDFRIVMENNGEEINRLCRARLAVKSNQLETRLQRFINISECMDEWFPVSLQYWAAHTGRFGGFDKTNLQNLTRGSVLRKGLVAPEGYEVIAADYSQIEARINAALAGQWDLVEQFLLGEDVYSLFASRVYGYEVNKNDYPDERFVGKTGILGLGYQMGPNRFYDTMAQYGHPVDMDFATDVVNKYRMAYPKIKQQWYAFNDLIAAMASGVKMRYGPVTTEKDTLWLPNGMPIYYPELSHDPSTNNYTYNNGRELKTLYGAKLVENVVQALARVLMTWAETKLADRGLYAAMSVHDELVYVVPEQHTPQVKLALKAVMTTPPAWLPKLPVACEIESGPSYGDCK